jgi:hypothetical protein
MFGGDLAVDGVEMLVHYGSSGCDFVLVVGLVKRELFFRAL